MNTHQMILNLNENEKIIIDLSYSIEEILPFDMVFIKLFTANILQLAEDRALPFLRRFKDVLKNAFDEKSIFYINPNQDIGYIWNKELKDDVADLVLILDKTESYWVGREYMVWSTTGNMKPHITTWIYNDPEGNIIFHITPVLKNIFTISKKKFDIWMQSYKPFLIRTIPKNVAQEWLNQINDALKIVESKLIK